MVRLTIDKPEKVVLEFCETEVSSEKCAHPQNMRWQHQDTWECCSCGRQFWGNKNETPNKDIYGS